MVNYSSYPNIRMRRMRQQEWIRSLVEETVVTARDVILPIFILEGENQTEDVPNLPQVQRLSVDLACQLAERAYKAGIRCVQLFPCIDSSKKTDDGSEAFNADGLLPTAVRAIKKAVPGIGVMGDIALDLYTSHGHDGVLNKETGVIENDETVTQLIRQALTQAEAGIDIVSPSDMMDGRVAAIREALEKEGYKNTLIFPHSAKYASALYGPYREAVKSSGNLAGQPKSTYQQNPANSDEAIRECALDVSEGADAIVIKPGSMYLDIIYRVRSTFQLPVLAYHVSGEYAMLKAAAEKNYIDYDRVLMEQMIAFKRAGCTAVITYAALDIAERLANE